MELSKIPKEIYLAPAAIMVAALVIAAYLDQRAPSTIVLLAGAALAFWVARINLKNREQKESKAGAETNAAGEAAKEGPLDKLRAETGMADELHHAVALDSGHRRPACPL